MALVFNKMSKVSVIVPFYNVKPYLKRCLDSLANQNEKDFEVILIDDGSEDGSAQIADQYVKKDARFRLYQKENGGEASARNLGLEKASGDFVMFLDADDYYNNDCIEKSLRAIIQFDCDIVEFGISHFNEEGDVVGVFVPRQNCKLKLSSHPEVLMEIKNCAWNKIYRRNLFLDHGIRYQTGYYTDFGTTFQILPFANEIGFIQETLINYFVGRPGSISTQFSYKCFAIFDMIDSIISRYKQCGFYDFYKEEIKGQAILNVIDIMRLAVASDNKKLRDEYLTKSFSYLRDKFGDLSSKYQLRFNRYDFLYFHPLLLKLYLLFKGKL